MQTDTEPTPVPQDTAQASLQRAIRARALDTINLQVNQPKPSWRRRLLTSVMVLLILLLLVVSIDFGVRVMHHIMQMWGYEEVPAPPPVIDPSKPFYITVEPPAEAGQAPAPTPGNSGAATDKQK